MGETTQAMIPCYMPLLPMAHSTEVSNGNFMVAAMVHMPWDVPSNKIVRGVCYGMYSWWRPRDTSWGTPWSIGAQHEMPRHHAIYDATPFFFTID